MSASSIGRPERDALQAVGRGATQFRMSARVVSRLGRMIEKAREGYRLTAAGRELLHPGRRPQWY